MVRPLPSYGQSNPRNGIVALCAFLLATFLYGAFIGLSFPYMAVPAAAPLFVLSLFILWAMPDRAAVGRPRWAIGIFLALFVAISIWPVYLSISVSGLPWISVQRLLGFALFALVGFRIATSKSTRADLRTMFRSANATSICLFAFAAIQLVAAVQGSSLGSGLNRFINAVFMWWGVLAAAMIVLSQSGVSARFATMFRYLTVISAVICLAEVWNGEILWADLLYRLPSFIVVDPEYAENLLSIPAFGYYRAKGVFTNSLSFAEFLALGSCFLAVRMFDADNLRTFAITGFLNLIVIAGLIYNGSRLGVVGAAAGYALAGMIVAYRRWRDKPNSIVASAAFYSVPFVGLVCIAAFFLIGRFQKLFVGTGNQLASTDARFEQFQMLPGPFLSRPILGYGPGNGAEALGYYQPGGLLTVDTYIISLLLDYGVLGFIAFSGALLSALAVSIRLSLRSDNERYASTAALAAALAAFLVIRLVLSQQDNHTLFFMLLGLFLVETCRVRAAEASRPLPLEPLPPLRLRTQS